MTLSQGHSGDFPETGPPRLYGELSSWWPLLSAPEEYVEEAEIYRKVITENSNRSVETVLELGSGGGNNASHLKRSFIMTLVDTSEGMLTVSRSLNPECEHIPGDMRNIRLGKLFDAVFIHDAISYMTTEDDLRSAIRTAFVHCRPGGVALFTPDYIRETFQPSTSHGGHDSDNRSMRYLEWCYDPDPSDTSYVTDLAYLLREGDYVRCEYDRHISGLFSRTDWLRFLGEAGFEARIIPFQHSQFEPGACELFLGVKANP
jgi:SAM-dependent methyltransferase